MKCSKTRVFNIVLAILPIVDLLTSLTTRFTTWSISIGIIVKTIMLVYFVFYIMFVSKSKYKKMARINLIVMVAFAVCYFAFKPGLFATHFLISEFSYMMKVSFLPILFWGLLCFFDDSGFEKEKFDKIFLAQILTYSLLFALPLLTKTSFNTYVDGSEGFIGWFYAGNEVSAICVLLLPFLYVFLEKKKVFFVLAITITLFLFSTIGTKVILFGSLLVTIIVLLETLIEKKYKANVFAILGVIVCLVMLKNSTSFRNMNKIIEPTEPTPPVVDIVEEPPVVKEKSWLVKLLSGRDVYIVSTNEIYKENLGMDTVLFGLGFSNTSSINDGAIEKLIEIDILDLFYHTGVIGLSINIFPFFYCLFEFFKIWAKKGIEFRGGVLYYGLMILLGCGISCISGHVLINPAVAIYLVMYLIYFLNSIGFFLLDTQK